MLIGGLSLVRLPVDLMPDVSFPSITVRVGYAGVGPLEMEELVTRPIEQAISAVAGLERLESTSSEGSSARHAELRVGHRPQRGGRRHPQPARSRARPAARGSRRAGHVQVRRERRADHGRRRRRATTTASSCARSPSTTCRRASSACPAWPRSRVEGGLRRQIHVELSKEKIRALDLPVDRVVSLLRTENQNIPLGEIDEGDRTYLRPQPGPVREPRRDPRPGRDDAAGRARSTCATSPRSRTRPRTSARSRASTASPASACASPSSRARTRSQIADAVRAEIAQDQPRGAGRHD